MLNEDEIIAAIESQEALSETYGNLSEDRVTALDYYLGDPMGNEVAGKSQVVSRDVWDAIEWIKPQLADIFCSGDDVVLFTPRGPEDVQAAEQETEYVNFLITQKNEWFTIWNSWSHDALLQKTGYVKIYWDDAEDRIREKYQNLTDDEFALLTQDEYVQVVEHEQAYVELPLGAQVPGYTVHNVTVERIKPCNVVRIVNIAPENIRVDQNARSLNLQDPSIAFVEQCEWKTITQLRDEGLDVEDDISDGGEGPSDWEDDLRDDYTPFRDREGEQADPSMRRVKTREIWMKIDVDEDGRAELMHFIVVGTKILLKEDADMVPIYALCPAPLPHQHYGLSVADAVMDIQRIKTALLRGSLDNLYLANNGRYAISEDVNLDDMLDSRAGGVVRVGSGTRPADAIFPLTHPTNGMIAVPMMEYMDRISQKRTGVNEQTQGLDENTLNKTATGAQMLLTAAQQRIKFIARTFAETGVRLLFQGVHALTLKNSRQKEMARLRNQWVPVDPRQWVKRQDMQVSVGLGDGSKGQQIALLQQQAQAQAQLMPLGIASPTNIYNTLKRISQLAGYKDPNEFWTDPQQNPPPPPGPPPELLKEQMKAQTQKELAQFNAQQDQMKTHATMIVQRERDQAQLELQASNDARDSARAQQQAMLDAELESMRIQSAERLAIFQAEQQKIMKETEDATKRFIAELQATTQLTIASATQQQKAVEGEQKMESEQAKQVPQDDGKLLSAVQQAFAQLQQQIQGIDKYVRAPRKFIAGDDGKPSHIEIDGAVRPIKRGPDGRIAEF